MLTNKIDSGWTVPVISTVATADQGISELFDQIDLHRNSGRFNSKKIYLLTEKAYQLLRNFRMLGIRRDEIRQKLEKANQEGSFNLYRFVDQFKN